MRNVISEQAQVEKTTFLIRGHIYKRKVKRQSVEMRRGVAPGPLGGAEMRTRADIHPELTLDKIQNPPDARRGALTSFGSR